MFTIIGIALHGAGFVAGSILRNVVPMLGAWYLLAPITYVYRSPGWRTLLIHWAVAMPLAVAARQLWVERLFSRATVVFLIAALALTFVFVTAGRLILWLAQRRGLPSRSEPASWPRR